MGWKAGVSSLQLGRAGSTVQARNPSDGTSEEPESVLRLLSHMTRESVSGGDKRRVLVSLSERRRGRCKGKGKDSGCPNTIQGYTLGTKEKGRQVRVESPFPSFVSPTPHKGSLLRQWTAKDGNKGKPRDDRGDRRS